MVHAPAQSGRRQVMSRHNRPAARKRIGCPRASVAERARSRKHREIWMRDYMRERLKARTPEQIARDRGRQRRYRRKRLVAMTPEERRAYHQENYKRRMAAERESQRTMRLAKAREAFRRRRASQTPPRNVGCRDRAAIKEEAGVLPQEQGPDTRIPASLLREEARCSRADRELRKHRKSRPGGLLSQSIPL
jgi:hypothetical protein